MVPPAEDEHDFSKAKRSRAQKAGGGYQTMMNDALKAYLAETDDRPLTESVLRRVIREELPASARPTKRSSGRSSSRR
jgi:hypothetical protein